MSAIDVGNAVLERLAASEAEVRRLKAVQKDLLSRLREGERAHGALAALLGERFTVGEEELTGMRGYRFHASIDVSRGFVTGQPKWRTQMLGHLYETLIKLLITKLSQPTVDLGDREEVALQAPVRQPPLFPEIPEGDPE